MVTVHPKWTKVVNGTGLFDIAGGRTGIIIFTWTADRVVKRKLTSGSFLLCVNYSFQRHHQTQADKHHSIELIHGKLNSRQSDFSKYTRLMYYDSEVHYIRFLLLDKINMAPYMLSMHTYTHCIYGSLHKSRCMLTWNNKHQRFPEISHATKTCFLPWTLSLLAVRSLVPMLFTVCVFFPYACTYHHPLPLTLLLHAALLVSATPSLDLYRYLIYGKRHVHCIYYGKRHVHSVYVHYVKSTEPFIKERVLCTQCPTVPHVYTFPWIREKQCDFFHFHCGVNHW